MGEVNDLIAVLAKTTKVDECLLVQRLADDFLQSLCGIVEVDRLKVSKAEGVQACCFRLANDQGPVLCHEASLEEEFDSCVELNDRVLRASIESLEGRLNEVDRVLHEGIEQLLSALWFLLEVPARHFFDRTCVSGSLRPNV